MFGYLSINLENEIENYINSQGLITIYTKNTPIDFNNYSDIINEVVSNYSIKTLIVEETIFYNSELILKFLVDIKMRSNVNLIFISFTKNNIEELIKYNIYNIIYYPKVISLEDEINRILIKPKNLVDLQNFVFAEEEISIDSNKSYNIAVVSTTPNGGSTIISENIAYLLGNDYKSTYIESPFKKSKLKPLYTKTEVMTTSKFNKDRYNRNNIDYIFSGFEKNWSEEEKLQLLVEIKKSEGINIFDFGYDYFENQSEIINVTSVIDLFIVVINEELRKAKTDQLRYQIINIFDKKMYITIHNNEIFDKIKEKKDKLYLPHIKFDKINELDKNQKLLAMDSKLSSSFEKIVDAIKLELKLADAPKMKLKENPVNYIIEKIKNPLK